MMLHRSPPGCPTPLAPVFTQGPAPMVRLDAVRVQALRRSTVVTCCWPGAMNDRPGVPFWAYLFTVHSASGDTHWTTPLTDSSSTRLEGGSGGAAPAAAPRASRIAPATLKATAVVRRRRRLPSSRSLGRPSPMGSPVVVLMTV